jgi:hypothetical protein
MNVQQLKKIITEELKKVLSEAQDIGCRGLGEKGQSFYRQGKEMINDGSFLNLVKKVKTDYDFYVLNEGRIKQGMLESAVFYLCHDDPNMTQDKIQAVLKEAQAILRKKFPKLTRGSKEQIVYMNLDILIGAANYYIYQSIEEALKHTEGMGQIEYYK